MRERLLGNRPDYISSVLWGLIAMMFVLLMLMTLFHPSLVSGSSMQPNLQTGDVVIVAKTPIKRGSIVVASGGGSKLIKRVVGMPNDVLEFKRNPVNPTLAVLYVNGELFEEGYLLEDMLVSKFNSYKSAKIDKPIPVPENHYFIMGDNRNISEDSRELGAIPVKDIAGVVVSVYKNRSFSATLIKMIYRSDY